jgi:hypothetical protein
VLREEPAGLSSGTRAPRRAPALECVAVATIIVRNGYGRPVDQEPAPAEPGCGWLRPIRIVGIGFAAGSLEHLIGLVLLGFQIEMFTSYPAWRHAAFAFVDAGIAYLAFTRPRRVFIPLLAMLIEQIVVNGSSAWRTWCTSGEILWSIPLMIALMFAASIVARQERLEADPLG